jgi:CheY-like chemotaxis protein
MDFEPDKVKILVIDDSDVIRNSLKKFLSEYDVDVITCNDGLEGLQKAVETKPQLIFMDLLMPNLDGIKLLRVLKVLEDLKHIPVIVISSHTDKMNVLAAMEAGAERIVSKPLVKESLIKSINEVLGHNFLVSAKRVTKFTTVEKDEISKELKRFFANSIIQKKDSLLKLVSNKNTELLKIMLHELKGSSGTAGFSKIYELCKEIENILSVPQNSWKEINSKCELLVKGLNEIETLYVN